METSNGACHGPRFTFEHLEVFNRRNGIPFYLEPSSISVLIVQDSEFGKITLQRKADVMITAHGQTYFEEASLDGSLETLLSAIRKAVVQAYPRMARVTFSLTYSGVSRINIADPVTSALYFTDEESGREWSMASMTKDILGGPTELLVWGLQLGIHLLGARPKEVEQTLK